MKEDIIIAARLEQICSSFVSEGYQPISTFGSARYLRHTNGNRITIITVGTDISIMKNGRLVKTESIVVPSLSTSGT